jgi:hypothetical protein
MPGLVFVAALLFAAPLVAAPVPKALKKTPAAPPVVGTTWVGKNIPTDGVPTTATRCTRSPSRTAGSPGRRTTSRASRGG